MKKICFGKNITAVNNSMTHLTVNIKDSLREVYRFPQNLVDISNCFNGCSNFTKFEATLPNSIQNMSNSFNSCTNFYKNISIPSMCTNMTQSFQNSGIKGSMIVPSLVSSMNDSFRNTNIESVYFENNDVEDLYLSNSFRDCKKLKDVFGKLPKEIATASYSFANTNIKNVDFLQENTYASLMDRTFLNCQNLKEVNIDLKSRYFWQSFDNCTNLRSVKNITTCEGTLFHMFSGCVNLNKIGVISSENTDLILEYTFPVSSNYSDIIQLNPEGGLCVSDKNDKEFLNSHPLRIYGTGHGIENELNFQNAHVDKGDYISGYCDPDDFDINSSTFMFSNYRGVSDTVVLRPYVRTDLLDESTKRSINFYNTFNGMTFKDVYMVNCNRTHMCNNSFFNSNITGNCKIFGNFNSDRTFQNSNINNLNIYSDGLCIHYGAGSGQAFGNANINNFFTTASRIMWDPFWGATINNGSIGNRENPITKLALDHSVFRDTKGNLNIYTNYIDLLSDDAFRNSTMNTQFFNDDKIAVKQLGRNVFFNSSVNLDHLSFDKTERIGENAFYNSAITDLTLSDNVELVANSLAGMNSLTTLNTNLLSKDYFYEFPPSLKNVTLRGNSYTADSTKALTPVENIYIINDDFNFSINQFDGLSNLKYVDIKSSIKELPGYTFYNCVNLEKISNIDGATINGFQVFYNCKSLKRVSLGAFNSPLNPYIDNLLYGCDSLEYLSISGFSPFNFYRDNHSYARAEAGQLFHVGRYFGAALYYSSANDTTRALAANQYYLGSYRYYSSGYKYIHGYVDTNRIPSSLKEIYYSNCRYTNQVFRYFKYVENITVDTPSSSRQDTWEGNVYNYYYTFTGCDNLKNLNLNLGTFGAQRLLLGSAGIPSGINANIRYTGNMSAYPYAGAIPSGFSNLSLIIPVNTSSYIYSTSGEGYFPSIPYNYAKNITIPPTINHNGQIFYGYGTHSYNKTFPTNGIAFLDNSVLEGNLLKNDKYYYFKKNISIVKDISVNNCVFYIDRFNNSTSLDDFFKNTTNSKVYCNGWKYTGAVGLNTKVTLREFNVNALIERDINN